MVWVKMQVMIRLHLSSQPEHISPVRAIWQQGHLFGLLNFRDQHVPIVSLVWCSITRCIEWGSACRLNLSSFKKQLAKQADFRYTHRYTFSPHRRPLLLINHSWTKNMCHNVGSPPSVSCILSHSLPLRSDRSSMDVTTHSASILWRCQPALWTACAPSACLVRAMRILLVRLDYDIV